MLLPSSVWAFDDFLFHVLIHFYTFTVRRVHQRICSKTSLGSWDTCYWCWPKCFYYRESKNKCHWVSSNCTKVQKQNSCDLLFVVKKMVPTPKVEKTSSQRIFSVYWCIYLMHRPHAQREAPIWWHGIKCVCPRGQKFSVQAVFFVLLSILCFYHWNCLTGLYTTKQFLFFNHDELFGKFGFIKDEILKTYTTFNSKFSSHKVLKKQYYSQSTETRTNKSTFSKVNDDIICVLCVCFSDWVSAVCSFCV